MTRREEMIEIARMHLEDAERRLGAAHPITRLRAAGLRACEQGAPIFTEQKELTQ